MSSSPEQARALPLDLAGPAASTAVASPLVGGAPGPSREGRRAVRKAFDARSKHRQPGQEKRFEIIGATLLAVVFSLISLGVSPTWLAELQNAEFYKIASGSALAVFLLYQWYLSSLRFRGRLRRAKRQYVLHKNVGILAPVLFYAHSVTLGYAYLLVLSSAYFANILVGLLNPQTLKLKSKTYHYVWMVVHVALSVLVITMMVYHLWIALRYE